ncbi:MAG: hypothetical protein ACJAYJ_000244 [Saprospiraceae bacterium]|jgi:hypothetical protein
MKRSVFKNETYFKEVKKILETLVAGNIEKLNNNEIHEESIPWVKKYTFKLQLDLIKIMYSGGHELNEIKAEFPKLFELQKNSWRDDIVKLQVGKNKWIDQYNVGSFTQMLEIISIGILLNVEDIYFKKIHQILDKQNIKEKLFDYLLKSRLPSIEVTTRSDNYKPFNRLFENWDSDNLIKKSIYNYQKKWYSQFN